MKIAQVVCVFPPYKGGIGTMAYNHALSLAELGHSVDVITPSYKDEDKVEEEMNGFRIKRLKPSFSYGNAGFCPQIMKFLDEYDIVHLHYPCFGIAEFVWWAKRRRKSKFKLVVTYHMDVVGVLLLRPFFSLYRRIIMPSIIKIADKVIVTSNDYAANSHIGKLFYRIPEKFHDIPPEVDTDHYRYTDKLDMIRRKHNIGDNDKVLLFVGGLDKAHYFKGVEFLINSFELLKNSGDHDRLKLIIVGDGDLRECYEGKVKEKQLTSDVIFAPKVGFDDLPKYYSLADVLVLPSTDKSEAFGIVLIEAMSCKTPVIASSLPGVRTVVTDGVDGYTFTVNNEGEFAAKVNDLLCDDDKIEKFGIAGRVKAEQLFSKKIIVKKLMELYQNVL